MITKMENVMVDVEEVVNQIINKLEKMKFEEVELVSDRGGEWIVGKRKSKGENKLSFTIQVELDLEEYDDYNGEVIDNIYWSKASVD